MDDRLIERCLTFIDQHTRGVLGGADLEREARALAVFVAAECESARLAGVKEGLEMAAKACEQQARDFLSPQYSTGQPLASFAERLACALCATAIRAIPVKADDRERA